MRITQRVSLVVRLSNRLKSLLLNLGVRCQEPNAPRRYRSKRLEAGRKHGETDRCQLDVVELSLLVEHNVGLDTRLMRSVANLLLQVAVELG